MSTFCKTLLLFIHLDSIFISFSISAKVDEKHNYIDLNNLIVISDSFSEGPSYFGFSFVLRNELNLDNSTNSSWVFIGAPKGNYSENSDNSNLNEPGVLWRCSIHSDTKDICEILEIDPTKAGQRDCRPNRCPNEMKNNSGLGRTMTLKLSDPSRLIVCAPQWKREENPGRGNFKFNGLCYWLSASVIESKPFNMTSMIRNGYTSQRLFPFLDARMQTVSRFPVWASGEVGFSSHMDQDGSLYLGAPGVNGWNGSIVRYTDNWSDTDRSKERVNRNDQFEFSKFNVLQTEIIEHFYHLEYFGYAVTTGVFFHSKYDPLPLRLVAGGAPRGGFMKGTVLIFLYPEEGGWLPDIAVQGDQYGSYFGSVLCAMDLNGDGIDELLVGAPLQNLNLNKEAPDVGAGADARNGGNYSAPGNEESGDSPKETRVGDQGCVFVYSSKVELYSFDEPEIICGTKIPWSKFGSTIVALGDINGDGFNDVAIAAPFENDGEGAVYIYKGDSKFGLKGEFHDYYQKISPTSLKLKLSSFGLSIFGGVDLDGNKTPDFGIGSYDSQAVVIIRTRPSIQFEGRIDLYINNTEAEKIPLETPDFIIRTCNRIFKGPVHSGFDLSIKLIVDEDLERFQIYRSYDGIPYKVLGNSTIIYNITIRLNQTICHDWLARTTSEFESNESPILSHPKPLTISQYLVYEEEFHDVNADLIRYHKIVRNANGQPELNISGPEFHDFCSSCPPMTELTTVFHLPIAADNCMDDGDPICTPDLRIYLISRDGQTGDVDTFVVGSANVYKLKVQIINAENAETIYFPIVDIFWKSPPLPEVTSDCHLNLTETINKASADVHLQCDFGYTIQQKESREVEIRLYMHGIYTKQRKEQLNIEVIAYPGKDFKANKTKKRLGLSLEANVDVFIVGSSENATFSNESFTNLTQTFRISLMGESPVESVGMTFWFPLMKMNKRLISISQPERSNCWTVTKNGNFVLERYIEYQPLIPKITEQITTYSSHVLGSKQIRSQNLQKLSLPRDHWKSIKKLKKVQLHCNNGDDLNCLRVDCETTNIVPNHNIMLEFRLSVDTALAKNVIGSENALEVMTIGFVYILNDTGKFSTAYTRISEFSLVVDTQVSFWIYVISGVAGLIILILLVLLLLKCGFFQRPVKVKAELHAAVTEGLQNWARWEYSQIYTPS